jgi:hypothetical protein
LGAVAQEFSVGHGELQGLVYSSSGNVLKAAEFVAWSKVESWGGNANLGFADQLTHNWKLWVGTRVLRERVWTSCTLVMHQNH